MLRSRLLSGATPLNLFERIQHIALTEHGDVAFLQEQNLVRSRQGGGSMSDDDKGHPRLFELKDRLGESRLSGLVEIGVWFIENDESRAAKYRTREPDALTLTTREPNAAVADPSVVALRQMLDHLVRTGEPCRVHHRLIVDGLHPRDVVAH